MSDFLHCHPLQNQGSSQLGRLVKSLQVSAFQLDERTTQDLIVEAHRFAQTLKYFDETNSHPSNAYWDRFWEVEIITYLAIVAATDIDDIKRQYFKLSEQIISAKPAQFNPSDKKGKELYLPLLEKLQQLALSLDEVYTKLVEIKHPLQSLLLNRIRRDNQRDQEELEGVVTKLIGYHKGSAKPELPKSSYEKLYAGKTYWGLKNEVEYYAIKANPNYSLEDLHELFYTFFNTWQVLKNAAQTSFDAELARMELPEEVEYRVVQPHIVLFLVFLRLFRHAQESLNELGLKQLDFFYEEVLGMKRRGEVPDEVFLLFELAKDFDQHLLEKGTLFSAGKDKNGRPILYETIEDWVLRPAQVADIKNTWIDENGGGIHGNPDVKKGYDIGVELPNEKVKTWRTFGDDQDLPNGELGFAIASPQLILREGKRVIDIRIMTLNDIPSKLKANNFEVYLSSEEEWIELNYNSISILNGKSAPEVSKGSFNIFFASGHIHIRIILERNDPPVVKLGEKLAEEYPYGITWPILKVLIKNKNQDALENENLTAGQVFHLLRKITISKIEIAVDVVGVKENLIIQSDQGVFDGTQKVFPFGPIPEKGNHFYIGSTEIFQKALSNLKVSFDWIDKPDDFAAYYQGYTADYQLPNPSIEIGFIDKASIPSLKQISKKETPYIGNIFYIISGQVSELTQKGIEPLTGFKIAPADWITSVNYLPGNGFRVLSNSNLSTSSVIVFEKEQIKPEDKDYEPLKVNVLRGSPGQRNMLTYSLDVLLFPKQKRYYPYDKKFTGKLMDIYGNLMEVAQFDVLADGKKEENQILDPGSNPRKNNFELNLSTIPGTVKFMPKSQSLYEPLEYKLTEKFSIIDGTLYPVFSDGGKKDNNDYISGVLKKPGEDGGSISGATLDILDKNGLKILTTKTNEEGKFYFPKDEVEKLSFKFADHWPRKVEEITIGDKGNFTIQIIPPLITKKIPKNDFVNVSGVVNNLRNQPFEGVKVSLKDDTKSSTTNRFGKYELIDIPKDGTLVFLHENFRQEVKVDDNTNIDLVFPPYEIAFTESASPDLKVIIRDSKGKGIEKVKVKAGSKPEKETDQNGECTISGFNNSDIEIKNDYFNYNLNSIDEKYSQLIVNVLPTINNDTSGGENGVIQGRLIDLQFNKVHLAKVCAKNGDFYYEVLTNAQGEFEIPIPEFNKLRSESWTIYAFLDKDDDHFQTMVSGVKIKNYLSIPLGHVKKHRNFDGTISGTVYAIGENANKPLLGALVKIQGVEQETNTDENGRFIFTDLPPQTPGMKLKIIHPNYEPYPEVLIDDNSELEIILLPVPIKKVIKGKITDILFDPLAKVSYGIKTETEEIVLGSSDDAGGFEIGVTEAGLKDSKVFFKHPGYLIFEPKIGEILQTATNSPSSLMDIRLYYSNLNYKPFIENNTIKSEFDIAINAQSLERDVATQEFEKYSPTLKRGFIRLTLRNADFLHKEYSKVLAKYTINVSKVNEKTATVNEIPNTPYTPATNGISLDYSSTQIITGARNEKIDQFFHLLPFNGHKDKPLYSEADNIPQDVLLIYPYQLYDSTELKDELYSSPPGNLFLGISDLQPGGSLALLFEVAPGSSPDPEANLPSIHWSYLTKNNQWKPFAHDQIIKDQTFRLTRSGIVQFSIPPDAVKENTMLNPEYFWLRAAARGDKNSLQALPAMKSIRAQVVQARFKNIANEPSHLAQPLPADTISNLLESRTAIKKVEQPLESFGGRLPESVGQEYYIRVSERLRHKDRAITIWDHEKLLLEQFSTLATAKCIPHARYKPPTLASELAPGYTTVAVIPNLNIRQGDPWPEPRFSQGDLNDMRIFLLERSNLFMAFGETENARLQIVNPLYEKVNIKVNVVLAKSAVDQAFYLEKLKTELTHYLSPWLRDLTQAPIFGRKIQHSAILQFIEARTYVDYVDVDNFSISILEVDIAGQPQLKDPKLPATETNFTWRQIKGKICPSTARSILIAGEIITESMEQAGASTSISTKMRSLKQPEDQLRSQGITENSKAEPELSPKTQQSKTSTKRKNKK